MSRDFVKAGYLHKTPPNKTVSAIKRLHCFWLCYYNILSHFFFVEVSEEILCIGQSEIDVL